MSIARPKDTKHTTFKLPSRNFVNLLIVLFIIGIIGVCIVLINLHYDDHVNVARRNLHNLLIVQSQVNQEIFHEVDNLFRSVSLDLEDDELNIDHLLDHYLQFTTADSLLRTLLLIDPDGNVVFDSRTDENGLGMNVADREYYQTHLTSQSDTMFIGEPIQSRVDGEWLLPVSRSYYQNGELKYIMMVSISPAFWSEAFTGFDSLDEYVGILTHEDGTIITTLPYNESLIGTQVRAEYLASTASDTLLPSLIDDDMSLFDNTTIGDSPLHLIIEVANTEALFEFDSISATITSLAIITILSGMTVLVLYSRQHRVLRLRTDHLARTNQDLEQEIQQRTQAEDTLSTSEERYRMVTDVISDYAFSIRVDKDKSLQREWITESFYSMMGLDPDDIEKVMSPVARTHPDDADLVLHDLQQTINGEETVTEYRAKRKSGDYIWIRVKRRPIWNDVHTQVIRIIGAASNITAQKEAELALQESEQRYRLVTEMISDYAFSTVIHDDGTLTRKWLTDSFYTMTGYGREHKSRPADPMPRTHPDDLQRVQADLDRTLAGEETISVYRWRVASGDYIWTRVKRRPIWNDDHTKVIRIIGAVSDITAQKEAELALQESEQRYRLVTEMISDYAFSSIIHEDGTWTPNWITDKFYEISGYTADDYQEFTTPAILVHPDDINRVDQDIRRTVAGESTKTEYRAYKKSGELFWLRVTRQPIWNDDHTRVTHMIGAGSDITQQKEAEIALQVNEERYREVTELMTDYAFSISIDEAGNQTLDWVVGSYEEITGKQDVLTQEENYIVDPDEAKQLTLDKQRTLNGERTVSEYRIRHQGTGEIRWLRVSRQPIWNDDHTRVIRFIGAASDITTQKETELALQTSQRHYREVTEIMSDYAFSVRIENGDASGIEWVVGSLESITGLTPDEVTDTPANLSKLAHPDDQQKLHTDLQKTLEGNLTKTQYRVVQAQTKYVVWLEVTRQPIWNRDQTTIERVVVVAKDITSQKHAETALAESEERYRLVSELISDYVYSEKLYPDQSSEIEWVAGSLESIIGVTAQDVYQQGRIPNRIHPDDYRKVNEDVLRTRIGNVTVSQYRVIHVVDESIHWVRESRRPIWDEDENRVIRIISAVSDITKEKSNADALRENEKRYRILTDLMSDYVFSLSVKPNDQIEFEWFAGQFEKITGMTFDEFQLNSHEDMTQISDGNDKPNVQDDIRRTLEGEPTVSEYRIINAVDNQPRWIRVSRYPEIDEQSGRVVRILGATTDITRQKQIEFALRDSEERYRLLTELMTDYAFSVRIEEDGRLYREWLVGDFERIMGYDIPESGYLDDPSTTSPHTDNRTIMEHDIEQTLQGKTITTEYSVINPKDNQPRWIRVTRQPIWNRKHTHVIRYLGAVKDITAEKEAEQITREADQLRQDLEREKGLHELRSRFVSMVTHEFRNPLAAIQSSVSILDKYGDRLTADNRQEKFVRIYNQIDRLTNLLEDLLQVGEMENQVLHFTPQRVDVIEIINGLYDEYRYSIGQDHDLVLKHTAKRIFTYADVILLERAFGNIISNAIKYSPSGSQVITTIGLQAQQIIVTIQDFGMGIPQRDYDNLYKAFYRASNVSTQPGTGLGLIIAKQSIELHKGTITFDSTVGEGTIFTIMLPQTIGSQRDT